MLESALKDSECKCSGFEKELSDARDHINMVESQLATTNDRLLELEQSKAVVEAASSERLAEITELQRRLKGNEVKEDLVGELREQVESLERQLSQLQEKVRGKRKKNYHRNGILVFFISFIVNFFRKYKVQWVTLASIKFGKMALHWCVSCDL